MIWTRPSISLIVTLLLQGCAIYSFSGTSLSSEVKTFSIQCLSEVALGPPDLSEKFIEKLSSELLQRSLKQVETQGNIQFEAIITQFKYEPVAPSSSEGKDKANKTRLTIKMKVKYSNPFDDETSFSKKEFSQNEDMNADASTETEEPKLVEKIFTKLVNDLCNASVANW